MRGLLWGHYNHGELRVQGGLQARVALFTDEYHLHIEGPEQVEFLLDEVRPVHHLAEFSGEVLGAVADGSLEVAIGGRYPLTDAGAAYEALEGRATEGKLVLIP